MTAARARQPEGSGWEPWAAASAPEADFWVNEERLEMIRIVEDGAERRIVAPDATSFALEVADVERFYDASPKFGTRDSCALLTNPLPSAPARAPWLLRVGATIRQRLRKAETSEAQSAEVKPDSPQSVELASARVDEDEESNPLIVMLLVGAVGFFVVYPAIHDSREEKSAWLQWAERKRVHRAANRHRQRYNGRATVPARRRGGAVVSA